MGYRPVGFTRSYPEPDDDPRHIDRPTNPPPHDPLEDVFGKTFCGYNLQLADVRDENGGMHFFARCYATDPCRTLLDFYRIKSPPGWYVEEDTSEAFAKMRQIAIAKAEKIATQIEAHNLAHPSDRYGLIQLVGDDIIEKSDVERACQGGIVPPAGTESEPYTTNRQGQADEPPNRLPPQDGTA